MSHVDTFIDDTHFYFDMNEDSIINNISSLQLIYKDLKLNLETLSAPSHDSQKLLDNFNDYYIELTAMLDAQKLLLEGIENSPNVDDYLAKIAEFKINIANFIESNEDLIQKIIFDFEIYLELFNFTDKEKNVIGIYGINLWDEFGNYIGEYHAYAYYFLNKEKLSSYLY